MRISDWSSDVCSSYLTQCKLRKSNDQYIVLPSTADPHSGQKWMSQLLQRLVRCRSATPGLETAAMSCPRSTTSANHTTRSEEHTSELQSLMRNSYAVFCLKKQHTQIRNNTQNN